MTKWKPVAENEVTKYEEFKVALKRRRDGHWELKGDLAAFAEAVAPRPFDELVEQTERAIGPYLGENDPPPLSPAWYANNIARRIAEIRQLILDHEADGAASAAVELGIELMEARATSAWSGPLKHARKAEGDRSAATEAARGSHGQWDRHEDIDALLRRDPTLNSAEVARRLNDGYLSSDLDEGHKVEALAQRVRRYRKKKNLSARKK